MQNEQTVRVAVVVQRYGQDVVGGAESLARVLAERFVSDLGWHVEVWTTTALDYSTWRNELPKGCTTVAGVSVQRFDSILPRFPGFKHISTVLHAGMWLARKVSLPAVVRGLENAWFWAQGPVCPALLQHLDEKAAAMDAIVFVTYLYYPTVFGLQRVASKTLLVPTAHDERPFYYDRIGELLAKAKYILVNSAAERSLVMSRLGVSDASRVRLAGVGVDMPSVVPAKETVVPYILYLGRIGDAKGVGRLLDWFLGTATNLRLLLAGKLDDGFALPKDPRVEFVGYVDEARKISLIRNATALVNPSRFESLSLVVLEAMSLEVPVLVNAECEALAYYARETKTVFAFDSQQSFSDALAHIRRQDWSSGQHQAQLQASRDWVSTHYSWAAILQVFAQSVAEIRSSTPASLRHA